MIYFAWRNPTYVMRHPQGIIEGVRRAYKTTKAMTAHKLKNPVCVACGTHKRIHTHHIVPVSVNPGLAHVDSNFLSLCHRCHFTVGHANDWKDYRANLRETISKLSSMIIYNVPNKS